MNKNHILTFDLFNKICSNYNDYLKQSKNENTLDVFSDFAKKQFEMYGINAEQNLETLYTLYTFSNKKERVDFTKFEESIAAYKEYVNLVQQCGFDVVDNVKTFQNFVQTTASGKNMDENATRALYSLLKLSKSKDLVEKEENQLTTAVKMKLRKMHGARDFMLKKGGAVAGTTVGVVGGAVAATALGFTGLAGILGASAVGNAIALGVDGAIVGGAAAAGTIKAKNVATRAYYKKKYRANEKEMQAYENGITEEAKITKLVEKVRTTNEKLLDLNKDLPQTNNFFGKVKNFGTNIGRFFAKHALNVTNRNRIHTISDELSALNVRLAEIENDSSMSENEKQVKKAKLNNVIKMIAQERAEQLLAASALALTSKKSKFIENLDIYAKDLLPGKQRKDKKIVKAVASQILDDLARGDITKLAGNYDGVLTLDSLSTEVGLLPAPAREVTVEQEDTQQVSNQAKQENMFNTVEAVTHQAEHMLHNPNKGVDTTIIAKKVGEKMAELRKEEPEVKYSRVFSRKLDRYLTIDEVKERFYKNKKSSQVEEEKSETVNETAQPETTQPEQRIIRNRVIKPMSNIIKPFEDIFADEKPYYVLGEGKFVTDEELAVENSSNTIEETIEATPVINETPVVEETIIEETPAVTEPEQAQIIKKMILKFAVEPIIKKGEEVGKRMRVTLADGTKEKLEFKGTSEDVENMIAAAVRDYV